MTPIERIRDFQADLAAIRRDIHAHPELGFLEHRTADLVAEQLASFGIEVHRGIGGTGVVGVLRAGNAAGSVGLRADMDALPIQEANQFPHASRTPGVMHACGHDGHTTMLLGAARYLAETRRFSGTVHFIFQPAEEGLGGAAAMLADGLFERFPCDAIYGMHNSPGLKLGKFSIRPGAAKAGGAFFDIVVTGRGSHGARPEKSVDPVLAACHVTAALQSIVSRNVAPADTAVVSVTAIEGGNAYNVIPEKVTIRGTARAFKRETMELIEEAMRRVAAGVAAGFGATAQVDFRLIFAPLVNDPAEMGVLADAAAAIGEAVEVDRSGPAGMGSEDFSFMMEVVPGAYINMGNGDGDGEGSCPVHNPNYEFNDAAIPYGAAAYVNVVEARLPKVVG
jgi:hippurate hydrolase